MGRLPGELDDAIAEGGAPAWPTGCNQIDILKDKLFTNLPYMQGAFFYKASPQGRCRRCSTGARDVLQGPRAAPARMEDMIDAIKADTGFDPTACAQTWLLDTTTPTPGPCP